MCLDTQELARVLSMIILASFGSHLSFMSSSYFHLVLLLTQIVAPFAQRWPLMVSSRIDFYLSSRLSRSLIFLIVTSAHVHRMTQTLPTIIAILLLFDNYLQAFIMALQYHNVSKNLVNQLKSYFSADYTQLSDPIHLDYFDFDSINYCFGFDSKH